MMNANTNSTLNMKQTTDADAETFKSNQKNRHQAVRQPHQILCQRGQFSPMLICQPNLNPP